MAHFDTRSNETTSLLGAEGGSRDTHGPNDVYGPGKVARSNEANFSKYAVFSVFFFPALGGLLFGYDIGATSSVLTQLESSTYSSVSWYNTVADSSFLQGLITSNGVLGAMVGSIICFRIGDTLGRRRELLIAAILFLVGSLVESISGSSHWGGSMGLIVLMSGRVCYGLGCGFAMHGAPAYIGEMSPAEVRGVLVSMKEAMIVLGILLGYLVGYVLEDRVGGWRWTYGVSMVPSIGMGVGMYFMPPSARWLVLNGRIEEGRRSLCFVTPKISELAIAEIQASAEKANPGGVVDQGFGGLVGPSCRHALIAGVGLVTLQQVTGQPSVLYYADTIFSDVGLTGLASVLTGAFKLAATLTAVFTVDKHGRKKLLMIGCLMMLVALVMLTVSFMFDYVSADDCNENYSESSCDSYSSKCSWDSGCTSSSESDSTCCGVAGWDTQKVFILGSMFLYIGGYQVGFGPVSWLIISEVFPLELRGKAISVAVVVNFGWNLVVTLLFPTELDVLGSSLTFAIFALVDMYALYFIAAKVPETKGLSLEEIEALFLRMGERSTR